MSIRSLVLALSVVAAAALAACGTTTRFTATNPSPAPMQARHPMSVEVYTTGAPVRPYIEVGIIESRQSSTFSVHEMPEVIREMRERAAQVGCDAVVINGTSDKTVGGGDHDFSHTNTLKGFWGACIMWSPQAATAARS